MSCDGSGLNPFRLAVARLLKLVCCLGCFHGKGTLWLRKTGPWSWGGRTCPCWLPLRGSRRIELWIMGLIGVKCDTKMGNLCWWWWHWFNGNGVIICFVIMDKKFSAPFWDNLNLFREVFEDLDGQLKFKCSLCCNSLKRKRVVLYF